MGMADADLSSVVRAILNEADPAGLLARGLPENEYDLEVRDFVDLIEAGQPMSLDIIRAKFEKWFGAAWPIPDDAVAEVARRLALAAHRRW
jgi:hypothetical protein